MTTPTWQSAQQDAARGAWNTQGARTLADQTAASGAAGKAKSAADLAYEKYMGSSPTNAANYNPSNLANFQPSAVEGWLKEAGAPGSGYTAPAPVTIPQGGAGTALAAFDPSSILNFDPSAAGNTFARGAYGTFKNNLADEERTLTNKSVASGRLNTGLFDRDTGQVQTRLASDFDNAIAGAAVQFSGQRESALATGNSLNLSRAQGIDANVIARQAEADRLAEDTAAGRNAFTLAGRQTGLQGAEFADTQGFQKASALDSANWGKATYLDTAARGMAQTGLDAALSRETNAMREADTANSRADSFTSANRSWAASDRSAQDARDAAAYVQSLRMGKAGQRFGGTNVPGASIDREGVNQALAKSYGVPYVGPAGY